VPLFPRQKPLRPFGMDRTPFDPASGKYLPLVKTGIRLKNDFDEAIPAYAACEITEYDAGKKLHLVTQPTRPNLAPMLCVFNGPAAIPVEGYGFGLISPPVWAMFEGGAMEIGNSAGTVAESWKLLVHGAGFLVCGIDAEPDDDGEEAEEGKCMICPASFSGEYEITTEAADGLIGVKAVLLDGTLAEPEVFFEAEE